MRNQIHFLRHITTIGTILTCCLLSTQCVKCRDENPQPLGIKKLLTVKKPARQGSGAHYVEITITSLQAGDDLNQYTVQAVTTEGNGELRASTGKTGNNHNYDCSLTTATSLDTFYFIKGDAATFQAGKSVTIRCMYCPQLGTQEGEDHHMTIAAWAHDSDGKVVQEQEEEVVFACPVNTASNAKGSNKKPPTSKKKS